MHLKKFSLILLVLGLIIFQGKADAKTLKKVNFKKFFKAYQASFVLFDVNHNNYIRYNEEQCNKRLSPCSTFKIPNSLIGLESGVIKDANYLIKWNGVKSQREVWNQDHTLRSAIANSVVWYYQELARRVGEERMKKYIQSMHYGNEDISSGVDKFWLGSSLKISANEQIGFLYSLYNNKLPFSERSMNIVKDIIKLSKTKKGTLSGKTGSGRNGALGWFVGYVVSNEGNPYIFATNLEAKEGVNGLLAREIAEKILKDMNLL